MKKINTGSSDFSDLRKENVIYVDKTAYMRRLASDEENKVVFMSRPRRFGKSLTVSAFKALFQGRRELFRGLDIERLGWTWQTHPVIHFRFNELRTETAEAFEADLTEYVKGRLTEAGYAYDPTKSYSLNFADAIEALHAKSVKGHEADPEGKGEGVVILIDEYDAPVGHALDDIPKAEAIRARMSSLYAQMKDRTGCIRFLFMTGISKFTKLSVFSALSNIRDMSQEEQYATMFGYTEEELTANFEEHLRDHASIMGKSYEDYRAEMKRWYNGFRFAKNDPTTVYNPISVALTLSEKPAGGFSATWATTGRPSMLMNYLKREDLLSIDYEEMSGVPAAVRAKGGRCPGVFVRAYPRHAPCVAGGRGRLGGSAVERSRRHRGETQEGNLHLRAEGGRTGGQGLQADTREEVRRALSCRRSPHLAHRPLVRLPDAPSR